MNSRVGILFLAVASLLAQNTPQSTDWQTWMDHGIQAYRNARYAEAIDAFQKAVDLNPNNANAHQYLGTAYLISYVPGATSPENLAKAERAETEFHRLLELQPNDRIAIASLASLYYQSGTGLV